MISKLSPTRPADLTTAAARSLVDFQYRSRYMARPVILVEIIDYQHTVLIQQYRPGIPDIAIAAVFPEYDLGGACKVGAFGVEDAGADPERLVAVTISQ